MAVTHCIFHFLQIPTTRDGPGCWLYGQSGYWRGDPLALPSNTPEKLNSLNMSVYEEKDGIDKTFS